MATKTYDPETLARFSAELEGKDPQEILRWARNGESRYVCVATVNNVIEAYDDPDYVPGASFTPLIGIFNPDAQRTRDHLEAKRLQGDDAEADGAPPVPVDPRRGRGPTAF